MRLFAALALAEPVQDHLDLAVRSLAPAVPSRGGPEPVRWVPRELRHLTMAFYGEVPAGAVPGLVGELARALAGTPSLALQLHGAGVFSHRTLWVGAREQRAGADAGLVATMSACEDAGASLTDLQRRDRRRAHVTVARLRARRPEREILGRYAHALSVYAGPWWTADRVLVIASELGAGKGGAPVYEVLDEVPLTGA